MDNRPSKRARLQKLLYEKADPVDGRHAPRLPRFVPTLALCMVVGLLGTWVFFVGFARLTGADISLWLPRLGSIPPAQLGEVVKTTVTAAGLLAGLFAIVYTYRKQRVEEAGSRRADAERISRRYVDAAQQLGHEKPAVRLAGAYAMAQLADDCLEQRQTCVDVLCAYIRMPWDLEDGPETQVRRTIVSIVRTHLLPDAATSWSNLRLDFAGSTFRGLDLRDAVFSASPVFRDALFLDECSFEHSVFEHDADFVNATIRGGTLSLRAISVEGVGLNLEYLDVEDGGEVHVAPHLWPQVLQSMWVTRASLLRCYPSRCPSALPR